MLWLRHIQISSVFTGRGISTLVLLCASHTLFASVPAPPNRTAYRHVVLEIQQKIKRGQLGAAREALSKALRLFPGNGGLENLLGIVDIQQGRADEAKRAFSAAIKEDPRLTSAYLNLGQILMGYAARDPTTMQKATHLYEKVLRTSPNNEDANFEYAILLMWKGAYRGSLRHIARLPGKAHANIRVEALTCADQSGIGNTSAAIHATALMEANPSLTEQDVMLALPGLRAAHQTGLIAALLKAASRRHPLSIHGLFLLGLAQEAEGDLKSARTTLTRVYEMNNSWVAPLLDLTKIALARKKYQQALGYLAHARALEPNNASLAYQFGLVCVKLGLLDETIEALRDAVKLAPNDPSYNLGMGIITSFGPNPSEAIPYLQKYHSMRPQDPKGLLALGTGYFRAEHLRTASLWLQKAAKFSKTEARARYYLGRILSKQGKYQQAIEELQRSASAQNKRADVYVELGRAYMHLKKYAMAERALDRAIRLNPNSYAGNLALLRFYVFTHDPRRARQRKRFLSVRKKKQKEYLDAFRSIDARPLPVNGKIISLSRSGQAGSNK